MAGFGLQKMQEIQKELHNKFDDRWGKLSPEAGKEILLWLMIEAGEVADVMKKKGDDKIVNDQETRDHFMEEICDVFMYLNDVILCYSISPEKCKKPEFVEHLKSKGFFYKPYAAIGSDILTDSLFEHNWNVACLFKEVCRTFSRKLENEDSWFVIGCSTIVYEESYS